MDLWRAAWLWEWLRRRHVDAWLLCRRQAASRGLALMTLRNSSACKLNTAGVSNFQLCGLEKLIGADDPQHVLQTNGGLADVWYMNDGDILCHPILVPTYLLELDVANAKVGAERKPLNTELIYCVNDLNAAPLDWKNDERAETGHCLSSKRWKHHTRSADQLLAKADVILPSSAKASESAASITSCECTATHFFGNSGLHKSTTRLDNGPSKDSALASRRTA